MIEARANLGLALVSLGRFDEAIAQYRAALAQAPGDPGLRANLAMAYYQKGDLPKAAGEFSSLHEAEPGNLQIATLLGTCYMRMGRPAQAISVLSPLEKAHPDNLDLKWALGWALIRAGRTQEGFERAEEVAQAERYRRGLYADRGSGNKSPSLRPGAPQRRCGHASQPASARPVRAQRHYHG